MKAHSRFLKGQLLVLFTLVLPVLLGVMALGADFSIIYLNWAMVQKAADAAALAGASQLTGVPGSAPSVTPAADNYVYGYACMNGVSDPSNVSTTPVACTQASHPGGFVDKIMTPTVQDKQVSVIIKRSVPYFFGKMIGLQEASVAASATAAIEATGGAPVFPVGLQCKSPCKSVADLFSAFNPPDVTFGSKFVLNNNNNNMQSSGGAPGNWGWVDVGQGQGASGLGTALAGGLAGTLSFGQTISTSPGIGKDNAQPAQKGLDARLASCAPVNSSTDPCLNGGDTSALKCNDPCLVAVPAIDFTNCNGNCSRQIEGFALMYLEQGSTTSAISACYVSTNNCVTTGSSGAPNLGSMAPPVLIN
ncbi:MAG TPA: pilus assembly protein TadG-related protein [Candidatus Binataceae bacterium]|nr:pilus assembly protein TadG-related protein [Candidatus Binataceae bacterium]